MKYIIRQKLISLNDRYVVQDENENEKYSIRRQVISLFRRYLIINTEGNVKSQITKKILTILPRFDIALDDGTKAVVKKKFKLFGHSYDIITQSGKYTMNGDYFGHEFEILKDEQVVAKVSKKWISWSDTYGVEVNDNQNDLLLLSIIITLDVSIHERD
jgi:uncharacterized protein YxjI